MLARELPKIVNSKSEGVSTANDAHGVLVLPVVGKPELRNVGGNPKPGHGVAVNHVVRQVEVERVGGRRGRRNIKTDASVIEAKLIAPHWVNNVSVDKLAGQYSPSTTFIKPG